MAEKLRRRLRAKLLDGLTHTAGALPAPTLRAALELASPLARFSRVERITRANLELALGGTTTDIERTRIAAGVRRHAARLFAEWLRLARTGSPADPRSAWIDEQVELDPSIEILERARRAGGTLIVTAHLGNWELLCARLARLGLQGAVIGFDRPDDSTVRWLERMRATYGVRTLPQSTGPREILRILGGGGTIGLLCDLEVRRLDGEFVPFFGELALTMSAPAALARAARLPLIPLKCVLERGRYRLSVDEPLALDPALERDAAQADLLARLNATYERWIRATPEQWAWHQRRWRTKPGEIELLPLSEQRRRERQRRLAAGKPVAPAANEQPSTPSD